MQEQKRLFIVKSTVVGGNCSAQPGYLNLEVVLLNLRAVLLNLGAVLLNLRAVLLNPETVLLNLSAQLQNDGRELQKLVPAPAKPRKESFCIGLNSIFLSFAQEQCFFYA
ncbi:MAG: hypothetical protein ACE3JK_02070 [Sporolactobacillus sp.]